MNITFISRSFPPEKSGIGDYVDQLASHLHARGHVVRVLTSLAATSHRPSTAYAVNAEIRHWSLLGLFRLLRAVRQHSPDVVVLEYAPHAFGWCGITFGVPLAMLALRWGYGQRLIVTGHELYWDWSLSPAHLLLAVLHRLQFFILVLAAQRWVFMTEKQKRTVHQNWPIAKDRLNQIPVGATVPRPVSLSRRSPQAGEFRLGLLSAMFDARAYQQWRHIIEALRLEHIPVRAFWIGQGTPPASMPESPAMTVTGPLDPSALAQCLGNLDVLLQLKEEGPTTRNTALISALSLGCPVVSLEPRREPRDAFWEDSGVLQVRDTSEMPRALTDLFACPEKRSALSDQARRFYERHFDWPLLAQRWEALL